MKIIANSFLSHTLLIAAVLLCGCKPDAQAKANQCISSCMAEHHCQATFSPGYAGTIGSDCLIVQNECIADCKPKNTDNVSIVQSGASGPGANQTPVPKPPMFGAIALDPASGAWGMADPFPDKKRADRSALYYCDRYGTDCKIVSSFSNTCAAVMTGKNNVTDWATAATAEEAQNRAQKKCMEEANGSCALQHAYCYF